MLLLTANDLKKSITMAEAILSLEQYFIDLYQQKVVMPARDIIPLAAQSQAFFMPCYAASTEVLGIKIATLMPHNHQQGLPLIHALVILIDTKTGLIQALLDGAVLTALRTGAVCGLATRLLAKPDATTVAIVGAGVQARRVLEAVCCVRPIKTVYVYSRSNNSSMQFKHDMAEVAHVPKNIEIISNISELTQLADIVCTATSTASPMPLIKAEMIKPGSHINSIGGRNEKAVEIDPAILAKALVVVDQKQAVIHKSAEIIAALANQYIKEQAIHELGEIILHKQLITHPQLSYFRAEGIALEDIAVANAIYQNALTKGIGQEINF